MAKMSPLLKRGKIPFWHPASRSVHFRTVRHLASQVYLSTFLRPHPKGDSPFSFFPSPKVANFAPAPEPRSMNTQYSCGYTQLSPSSSTIVKSHRNARIRFLQLCFGDALRNA
jgi:hypothetical protein